MAVNAQPYEAVACCGSAFFFYFILQKDVFSICWIRKGIGRLVQRTPSVQQYKNECIQKKLSCCV